MIYCRWGNNFLVKNEIRIRSWSISNSFVSIGKIFDFYIVIFFREFFFVVRVFRVGLGVCWVFGFFIGFFDCFVVIEFLAVFFTGLRVFSG